MPDLNRKLGTIAFPLTTEFSGSFVSRGHQVLLDVLKTAIIAEFDTVFRSIAADTELCDRSVIEYSDTMSPSDDYVKSHKFNFPALFVYPDGENSRGRHSLSKDSVTTNWSVEYILGTLAVPERHNLEGIFRAIHSLVEHVCQIGGHPAYATDLYDNPDDLVNGDPLVNMSGQNAGNILTWDDGTAGAGFSSISCGSMVWGAASFSNDSPATYYGCRINVVTTENTQAGSSSYGTYPHVAADFELGGDAAGTITDFVEIASVIP